MSGPPGSLPDGSPIGKEKRNAVPAPPEIHAAVARLADRWGCSRHEAVRRAVLLCDEAGR